MSRDDRAAPNASPAKSYRFKVGDRVMVVASDVRGGPGEVVEILENGPYDRIPYCVALDNRGPLWCGDADLVPESTAAPTPCAVCGGTRGAHHVECSTGGLRAGLSSSPASSELFPLAVRIEKGRQKYPTGCTILSLLDEAGEVAHAVNKRDSNVRVRDELLDVAAVAMRLYFGEIDTAWRPDFGATDGSSADGDT